MARTDTQMAVRIPPDLHKWLKELAAKNERSMNYLVVKAIKQMKQQMEL